MALKKCSITAVSTSRRREPGWSCWYFSVIRINIELEEIVVGHIFLL